MIDRMYASVVTNGVKGQGTQWATLPIAGGIYAAVHRDYPTISLRLYFKTLDNKAVPTRQGVPMGQFIWRALKKAAVELRERDPILRAAVVCKWDGGGHRDVEGVATCSECSPFTFNNPGIEVEMPPEFIDDPPRPTDDDDDEDEDASILSFASPHYQPNYAPNFAETASDSGVSEAELQSAFYAVTTTTAATAAGDSADRSKPPLLKKRRVTTHLIPTD